MTKNKSIITGSIFFVIISLIITFSGFSPMMVPTQADHVTDQYGFIPIANSYLLKQPIILKEDWLYGIDVLLTNTKNFKSLDNLVLITDTNYNILMTMRLSSDNVSGPEYYPFKFNKKIKIGKGHKCYLVVYSPNGSQDNSIGLGLLTSKKFSVLSVIPFQNNDVLGSLKNPGQPFNKSISFRTYETKYNTFSGSLIPLYLIAFLFMLVIIYFKQVRKWILRINIRPEKIYLPFALLSGLFLIFLIPPFQVPDEKRHFSMSYQVAEFSTFHFDQTLPTSLPKLYSRFDHMVFRGYEKTSPEEIKSAAEIKLAPEKSIYYGLPDIFLPYVPQATGMLIGMIFNLSPIWFLYLGRIMNLIIAILLIYLTIKTTPVLKWFFFLLGLMPMTVYLLSSLSQDVLTIGLSFLLIAILLNLAFSQKEKISKKDLVILFLVTFLLALCKPLYYLLAALFLLIPVKKIGSPKKYIVLILLLVATVFAGSQAGALKHLFKPSDVTTTASTSSTTKSTITGDSAKISNQLTANDQTKAGPDVIPEQQKHFILQNPVQYGSILLKTLFVYLRPFYLETFVGKFGWLDTPLAPWLRYCFLWMLLLTSICISDNRIKIKPLSKLIVLGILILLITLVETSMYVIWSPVGSPYIEGVQGRYFIPFAFLFFLLFYNKQVNNKLNLLLSPQRKNFRKLKQNARIKVLEEIQVNERVFNKFFILIIIGFSIISLITTLYTVLMRFWVILG